MSEILVVIAMVFQLLCGSATTEQANIGNLFPLFLSVGSSTNLNLSQSNWDEVDVKFDLGNGGYEKYGLGKGSSCRIHGNLNRGLYLDFELEAETWSKTKEVIEPVEGITITSRSSSDAGGSYQVSFGPLKWEDIVSLFNG